MSEVIEEFRRGCEEIGGEFMEEADGEYSCKISKIKLPDDVKIVLRLDPETKEMTVKFKMPLG